MKRLLHKLRPWLPLGARGFNDRRSYYYSRIFHKYDRLEAYLAVYRKCLSYQGPQTDTEIRFLKNALFGLSMKEAASRLPTSRYDVLSHETLPIKVLFYKLLIGRHRVNCHLHFFRDSLCLCSYTFPYLPGNAQPQVIAILQRKYLPGLGQGAFEVIADTQGSFICVEKGVELTLNYLSLRHGAYEAMQSCQEQLNKREEEKASRGETDMFNSL